jgi:hypothetical protein
MSSNSGQGINGILPQNMLQSITDFFTKNNSLNFLMHRGNGNIPYGFMGLATIAAGTFTYVTYTDYLNELSSGISESLDSMQSSEMFIPSDENDDGTSLFDTNITDEPITNEEPIPAPIEDEVKPSAPIEDEKKEEEEVKPSAPPQDEAKPSAPPQDEKKEEEPGEKYKMGGRSKKHRKRKNKTKKKKRKGQN